MRLENVERALFLSVFDLFISPVYCVVFFFHVVIVILLADSPCKIIRWSVPFFLRFSYSAISVPHMLCFGSQTVNYIHSSYLANYRMPVWLAHRQESIRLLVCCIIYNSLAQINLHTPLWNVCIIFRRITRIVNYRRYHPAHNQNIYYCCYANFVCVCVCVWCCFVYINHIIVSSSSSSS